MIRYTLAFFAVITFLVATYLFVMAAFEGNAAGARFAALVATWPIAFFVGLFIGLTER